jgi:hypothetical protein
VFERATADAAASTLAALESFLGGGLAPPSTAAASSNSSASASSSSSSSASFTGGSATDSVDGINSHTVMFANHGGVGAAATAVGRSADAAAAGSAAGAGTRVVPDCRQQSAPTNSEHFKHNSFQHTLETIYSYRASGDFFTKSTRNKSKTLPSTTCDFVFNAYC